VLSRVVRSEQQVAPRRRSSRSMGRELSQNVSRSRSFARRGCRTGKCLAALFLFVALSVQLWVRISIVSKSYDLERLRSEALQADSELRELRVVYAVQAQPTSVLNRSRVSLGLEPPQPQQLRRVAVSVL
jgi:hypothetical protein